ncbi:MAG: hypothetical protein JNM17_23605 [Archangium sp.]|nr:hypothetical protein [Archangium sp.]
MKSSIVKKCLGAVGLLALAACGPMVGSRYIKSQDVGAGQAALITVDANESPELAGTRLDIPVGALTTATKVTVELGLYSLLGNELSAGPTAVFGPANTNFTADVILSLPVTGIGPTDDIGIVAEDENGLTWEIDANQVALNAQRNIATFRIRRLASFQPRRRIACTSDSQCAMGLQCVNGRCQNPPTMSTDGGSSCPMSCPMNSVCDPARGVCTQNTNACMSNADCPMGLACVNGVCNVPGTNTCGPMGCPNGQTCTNGMCATIPSDGGTMNPNACMSNADCAMGELCFNGVCRAACVPHVETCNMLDDDCDGQVDEGGVCNNPNDGGVSCGNAMCGAGETCEDDPRDMCLPNMGAVCPTICVPSNPTDGGMTTPDGGTVNDGGMTCPNGMCTDGGSTTPDGGNVNDGGMTCPNGMCSDGGSTTPGDGGSPTMCRTSMECAMGQQCVMGVCL